MASSNDPKDGVTDSSSFRRGDFPLDDSGTQALWLNLSPLPLPATMSTRRHEKLRQDRKHSLIVSRNLPVISKRAEMGLKDAKTVSSIASTSRDNSSSMKDVVDFASGRGKEGLWLSLGKVQPSYEVPTLRKQTRKLELSLESALSAIPTFAEHPSSGEKYKEETDTTSFERRYRGEWNDTNALLRIEFSRLFPHIRRVVDIDCSNEPLEGRLDGYQLTAESLPSLQRSKNWFDDLTEDVAAGTFSIKH